MCVCLILTRGLPEHSAAHELQKALSVEAGPVNGHCVLNKTKARNKKEEKKRTERGEKRRGFGKC